MSSFFNLLINYLRQKSPETKFHDYTNTIETSGNCSIDTFQAACQKFLTVVDAFSVVNAFSKYCFSIIVSPQ